MVGASIPNPRGFHYLYAMDKNIKEKKVVCGMYKKGDLVLSDL